MDQNIFKFWTLNVNSRQDIGGLHHKLSSDFPDLIFLQEVVQGSDELTLMFSRYGYTGTPVYLKEGLELEFYIKLHSMYQIFSLWNLECYS